jgi:hypothetical protein
MIIYYRLMTNWSGLGDSTELSQMGLSHRSCGIQIRRQTWLGVGALTAPPVLWGRVAVVRSVPVGGKGTPNGHSVTDPVLERSAVSLARCGGPS